MAGISCANERQLRFFFGTFASVTGSLYVQMRIQNHLPEDEVWFCILKTLPWGIFERCFPLEYDWAFKRHVWPLLSKHRKTALNKPVSVDEAPEKLPRFTEGLPTLLETLPIDNGLDKITLSDVADGYEMSWTHSGMDWSKLPRKAWMLLTVRFPVQFRIRFLVFLSPRCVAAAILANLELKFSLYAFAKWY